MCAESKLVYRIAIVMALIILICSTMLVYADENNESIVVNNSTEDAGNITVEIRPTDTVAGTPTTEPRSDATPIDTIIPVFTTNYEPAITNPQFSQIAGKTQPGPFASSLRMERNGKTFNYPFMYPNLTTRQMWAEEQDKAPKTEVSKSRLLAKSASGSKDLLTYLNYVPSERNQGSCGNCWVWAGTGAMEIALNQQNGGSDRLSTQFFNSVWPNTILGKNACCGGNIGEFTGFYSGPLNPRYAVPWSNTNANWQDGDRNCTLSTNVLPATIGTTPHYPVSSITYQEITTHSEDNNAAIANIKDQLDQNKPVYLAYYLPDKEARNDFQFYWDNYGETQIWNFDYCGQSFNSSKDEGAGHAVLVVGYDDTDPQDSYWKVVNSWGTNSNRPHGLFRINMSTDYGCSYPGINGVFGPITGEHALYWDIIDVTFTTNYTVTPYTLTTGGTINPNSTQSVLAGESSPVFAIAAEQPGYLIDDVLVNDTSVGGNDMVTYSYSIPDVRTNLTINASFKTNTTFSIFSFAGANGTITPQYQQVLNGHNSTLFTISAEQPDYVIEDIRVNNVTIRNATGNMTYTYTVVNVRQDTFINATFKKKRQNLITSYSVETFTPLESIFPETYSNVTTGSYANMFDDNDNTYFQIQGINSQPTCPVGGAPQVTMHIKAHTNGTAGFNVSIKGYMETTACAKEDYPPNGDYPPKSVEARAYHQPTSNMLTLVGTPQESPEWLEWGIPYVYEDARDGIPFDWSITVPPAPSGKNSVDIELLCPIAELYGRTTTIRVDTIRGWTEIESPEVFPLPGYSVPPTDPDGDGLYEDLNGNSRIDFADVNIFFEQMDWITDNEPVEAFDFNKNGRIDFNDIILLYNEI